MYYQTTTDTFSYRSELLEVGFRSPRKDTTIELKDSKGKTRAIYNYDASTNLNNITLPAVEDTLVKETERAILEVKPTEEPTTWQHIKSFFKVFNWILWLIILAAIFLLAYLRNYGKSTRG